MMEAIVTAEAGGAVLRLEGVHKRFGPLRVLNGVDIEVRKGSVTCVIGPSGSGKSTLLRCINLLEPPEEGNIIFEGRNICAMDEPEDDEEGIDFVRRRVGMVFQQFNLFPNMSALGNVSIAQQKVLGRGAAEAREKGKTSTPTASRAASSNAWRSPGHWRWTRT
jgi:polar amino acid transport system ATP-binding protein